VRKNLKKLVLNRETLTNLSPKGLAVVDGASGAIICQSYTYMVISEGGCNIVTTFC
jgi:hypothetical protein